MSFWLPPPRCSTAFGDFFGAGQNSGAARVLEALLMISLLGGEGMASELAFPRYPNLLIEYCKLE